MVTRSEVCSLPRVTSSLIGQSVVYTSPAYTATFLCLVVRDYCNKSYCMGASIWYTNQRAAFIESYAAFWYSRRVTFIESSAAFWYTNRAASLRVTLLQSGIAGEMLSPRVALLQSSLAPELLSLRIGSLQLPHYSNQRTWVGTRLCF